MTKSLFTVEPDLGGIYLNAVSGINNFRSPWLPRLIGEGCNSRMRSDILTPPEPTFDELDPIFTTKTEQNVNYLP